MRNPLTMPGTTPARSSRPARLRWAAPLIAGLLVLTGTSPAAAVSESPQKGTWGTNGTVFSVQRVGSLLVIGGRFDKVVGPSGQTRAAGNLAALDAKTGAWKWSAAPGGKVFRLASDGTSVWAGGTFGLKRFSLTGKRMAFNAPHHVGYVRAIAVRDGRVYYGGGSGVAASTAAGKGLWRRGITQKTNGGVRTVALAGTRLLVGGYFCTIAGAARPGLAALTLSGAVDYGFRAKAFSCGEGTSGRTPYDLAVSAGQAYVAGAGHFNRLVKINASTGGTIWSRGSNGDYQTVTLQGGAVYTGGHFTKVCANGRCDIPRIHVAKYSPAGQLDPNWNPSLGPTHSPYFYGVWSLRGDAAGLYAGGVFQNVNGAKRRSVAIFR